VVLERQGLHFYGFVYARLAGLSKIRECLLLHTFVNSVTGTGFFYEKNIPVLVKEFLFNGIPANDFFYFSGFVLFVAGARDCKKSDGTDE